MPPRAPAKLATAPQRTPGSPRGALIALGVIVVIAGALRLTGLASVPPGLNQDSAADAWPAWCLLHTGQDHTGDDWPIFFARGLGANRPTLNLYALLPIQAVGGLGIVTTRLPQALGGVATVMLAFVIGRRLFGIQTGLILAALLALNPWHLQLSRLGHQGGFSPFLVCAILALLLAGGLPLAGRDVKPRWLVALGAGLVTGIVCYGYFPVRIFLPVLLIACTLATLPAWLQLLKTRQGLLAIAALAVGVTLTFGPLAYYHLAHSDEIGKRAENIWLWSEGASLATKLGLVAQRYIAHFGPDFLFVNGDYFEMQSVPGWGCYGWYTLPLMLVGLPVLAWQARRSYAARVALCFFLLYPLGDCLNRHAVRLPDGTGVQSLHALRSAPGLLGPLLVAAVGASAVWNWLRQRQRVLATPLAAAFGVVMVTVFSFFAYDYFVRWPQRPEVRFRYHTDLVQACRWLEPRFDEVDAVFITTRGMNIPYVVTLVMLDYDPAQWFTVEKSQRTMFGWDAYDRVGKLHFVYTRENLAVAQTLANNGRADDVVFIARPGAWGLTNPQVIVRDPDGNPTLHIYRIDL